ncbi:bifunctional 4-hydroxy-2-oxoglutarate aldolase/2-dehydro-3-deoxy-phosphogluconate aldolase [Planctomycetota bacterium]
MEKHTVLMTLTDPGVVAIIRSDGPEGLLEAALALYRGGARAVEISLTTPGALGAIESIRKQLPEACLIGAGTVLDPETVRLAILAGTQFIVAPISKVDLIQACLRYGVPVFSGAYTPTEAFAAYEAGADFIKIFPADKLGPAYIRALLAPMPQLALVPTGGVTPENCGPYFQAGCVAVAVGSSVVNSKLIAEQAWDTITAKVQAYVVATRAAKQK